jgi:hypothetical protein
MNKKNTIRLTESELKSMITKTVKSVLNETRCLMVEDDAEGMTSNPEVEKYLDTIDEAAREMQRIFFDNERWFDTKWYGMVLGFDNASGNYGTYDLWYAVHERHPELTVEDCLHELGADYNMIRWIAECEGYGPGAASRGFDVTRPMGRYWVLANKAIKALHALCDLYNVDHGTWEQEGIKKAREGARIYAQFKQRQESEMR